MVANTYSNMAARSGRDSPVVLILKSKNEDDKYEALLDERGYVPVFVPVLSFKFINQETLTERLKNPQQHSGIVFTSQRAVEAVHFCIEDSAFKEQWSSSVKEKWSSLPVFVTGKATGKQARKKLEFPSIFGEMSGSAQALAEIILKTLPADLNKELLFPCANIKKETLPNIVKEKGYGIHCITAYCTQPDPNLVESLQKLFEKPSGIPVHLWEASERPAITQTFGLPDQTLASPGEASATFRQPACIVFFSPSGVNFARDALHQTLMSFEHIKLVAIGHSTAQELRKHGLTVSGVPEKPDPQALLKVIDSILD